MQYNKENKSGREQAKRNQVAFNIKKSVNPELWLQIEFITVAS